MSNYLSPGVFVREVDLSTYVPTNNTSAAGSVGLFRWGPVEQRILINNEETLKNTFGFPSADNAAFWFSSASFLAYSSTLYQVRVTSDLFKNAVSDGTKPAIQIKNDDEWQELYSEGTADVGQFAARYPGSIGNSLRVSIADAASFDTWEFKDLFVGPPGTSDFVRDRGGSNDEMHIVIQDVDGSFSGAPGTVVERYQYASKASDAKYNTGSVAYYKTQITQTSKYIHWMDHLDCLNIGSPSFNTTFGDLVGETATFGVATAVNGFSIASNGAWTFDVSASDQSGLADGETATVAVTYNVIKDAAIVGTDTIVITVTGTATTPTASAAGATFTDPVLSGVVSAILAFDVRLSQGVDDFDDVVDGDYQRGWDLFRAADEVDVGVLFMGPVSAKVSQYVIDNIAETRRDLVVTMSPQLEDVRGEGIVDKVISAKNDVAQGVNRSTSYGVFDCNWKLLYDRYNERNVWVPLNADIAGLCARTDADRDPWWSPAGYQRGTLKNVVRLAWNPSKTERDQLYKNGVNPVVSFPGQGPLLYGDKTMLARPSAFDRINVRRLFLVLEKAIAEASKQQLFEFNDPFTRAQFRNLVEPFLRDVQGRRGIYDFKVVCDETNNTQVDEGEFVADIFIKPTKSINFVSLSFVATRTGVEFEEVVGVM